ncbi:hypothetical protein RRG08_064847 [Elysia crispata]|uniref:Uncharacterized protein n=1 Tax=Elysia crispata TaxID=231223 RepID=A0AAE1A323_9GAST|nr:hypothetical protein RRG08_064847 [Elysia crispata]
MQEGRCASNDNLSTTCTSRSTINQRMQEGRCASNDNLSTTCTSRSTINQRMQEGRCASNENLSTTCTSRSTIPDSGIVVHFPPLRRFSLYLQGASSRERGRGGQGGSNIPRQPPAMASEGEIKVLSARLLLRSSQVTHFRPRHAGRGIPRD